MQSFPIEHVSPRQGNHDGCDGDLEVNAGRIVDRARGVAAPSAGSRLGIEGCGSVTEFQEALPLRLRSGRAGFIESFWVYPSTSTAILFQLAVSTCRIGEIWLSVSWSILKKLICSHVSTHCTREDEHESALPHRCCHHRRAPALIDSY